MTAAYGWFYWALVSAVFAALTAIFAKIGLDGVDADFATLICTCVIMITRTGFVHVAGKWSPPFELRAKTWLLLGVSGLAAGASWRSDMVRPPWPGAR
jgi:transporter family protein